MYANASGLKGKLTSLKIAVNEARPEIVAITETKFTGAQNIHLPGYICISKSRPTNKGGGVAFLITNTFANYVSQIPNDPNEKHEAIWIRLNTSPPLYIATFYGKQESANLELVQEDLDLLASRIATFTKLGGNVLVLGDFNSKVGHPPGSTVTRNGQLLLSFTQQNNLTIINQTAKCKGIWTRVNPKHPSQRSVIDYVLASPNITTAIQEMSIDEQGHFKLHSKKTKSDHNTIFMTIQMGRYPRIPKTEKVYKWKITENTKWDQFENTLNHTLSNSNNPDQHTFEQWTKAISEAAHKTIGSKEVKKPNNLIPKTKEIKAATHRKRAAKKALDTAYKCQSTHIEQTKAEYHQAKLELENQVHIAEAEKATRTINKINSTGGVHSKTFWNIKRKTTANGEDLLCIRKEDNTYVHDPEDVKHHVAEFYENLYKPNTSPNFNQEHTRMTEAAVQSLTENRQHENIAINQPITKQELQNVLKNLPNNKSPGPNNLIYEFPKHGGDVSTEALYKILADIFESETLPTSWQDSTMAMLPKSNNKQPDKLANKRGLTLSDTTCKIFERILLNRISRVLPFSEAQAGARKGRSTSDQSFTLKSVLTQRLMEKKTTYLAFLDLHKAYDNIWKAAIFSTLWEKGITGKIWRLAKNLNNNLTTKIKTRYGYTRTISIQESIRQGGVLSGTEFSSLIDNAEQALQSEKLGVSYGRTKIASLLLMDDIILVAESPTQLQNMLNVMDNIANRWHLIFNPTKSKIMIAGEANGPHLPWRLGELTLQETQSYTYLGEVITPNLKLEAHLKHLQQKLISNTNRILAIASEDALSKIKMETFLHLHSRCLLLSILYNCETWNLTKAQTLKLEKLQLKALRRYLKAPNSTPKLAFYLELGVRPLEAAVDIAQLKYLWRLLKSPTRTNQILMTQVHYNTKGSWFHSITQKLTKYTLPSNFNTITQLTKKMWATKVTEAVNGVHDTQTMLKAHDNRCKLIGIIKHKKSPKLEEYMVHLDRRRASAIFRLRCKSTRSPNNMCSRSITPICTRCSQNLASDIHIFTDCAATEQLRNKYSINGLLPIYQQHLDLSELERYADFALEAELIPRC